MISFKNIRNGTSWSGVDWSVNDKRALAEIIARVALGQQRYALNILKKIDIKTLNPKQTALSGAIKLLSVGSGQEAWHRDGWVFQVLAWIAANLQDPYTLKSSPHMIHAHKGFDGVHIKIDKKNMKINKVVLCEEKATTGPRGKITSQVWPEFIEMENGVRDNELIHSIIDILERNSGLLDPDEAVTQIFWPKARSYRISITIGEKENRHGGREFLFSDYENTVKGEERERRAETFYCQDLRAWMDDLANMAITEARKMV